MIIVAPERLEAMASVFDAKQGEMRQIIQILRNALYTLDGEWDGVAQTRFYDRWNETLPQMVRFAEMLAKSPLNCAGSRRPSAKWTSEPSDSLCF